MTVCEQWGAWAAGLRLADVPQRVRERARLQIDSMRAAAAAGGEAAAPFARQAPDGPPGRVYANAAASIAHDWDDYLFMGHTGHSTVWSARAMTDDPERQLLAQVAGNELAGRLGAALLFGPHNGQFWASIHCAGAATAAGVALGLGEEEVAHALAIALYQPPYGLFPGFMGPPTKLLTAAEPAAQGARAALLAADGVRGALEVIEARRGLLAHFAFVRRPAMLGALGRVWLTDTLAFKPWPGCAYVQAAIEAALRARAEAGGLAPEEVTSIEVHCGYLTVAMEALAPSELGTPASVNFSTARSVAVALLAGRLTQQELAPSWLADHGAEIEQLAARVRVRHDWELTAQTLLGTTSAGGSAGDVTPAGWATIVRRMRELGMADATLSPADLLELARRPALLRQLGAAVRLRRREGLAALDTGRVRLTFPCRLQIRLRSGAGLALEGAEPGSCNRPLAEQREVISAKLRLTEMATAPG